MSLVSTLNTIDTRDATMVVEHGKIKAARTAIGDTQELRKTAFGQLEIDIRAANTTGVGNIPAGFLDGHTPGTVEPITLQNQTRIITFDYHVSTDTIINLNYRLKVGTEESI